MKQVKKLFKGKEKRSKTKLQRIVVAAGQGVPSESYIIEVPAKLKTADVVYARPKIPSPQAQKTPQKVVAEVASEANIAKALSASPGAGPSGAVSTPKSQASYSTAIAMLNQVDSKENSRIMSDLREFQNSRRRLLFEVSSIGIPNMEYSDDSSFFTAQNVTGGESRGESILASDDSDWYK